MRLIQVLIVLVLLAGWTTSIRAAELVVIASSDPSIEVGVIIDGAQPISVAANASVVLVSSSGRTIKLAGPYNGAPDPSASGSQSQLVDTLSRLITQEASSPTTLAVFRAAPRKTPADRPDIWGIDIARAGKYCLRPDRPAVLWWAAARTGAVVSFSPAGDSTGGARISWPPRKRHLAWPKELVLSDGAAYVARFWSKDEGERLITLLMPELATDAHRAAWMANHGCTRQALKVLDAMGKEEL